MERLITGIHHVALKCRGVAEFERTVRFYKEILCLPVARSWGIREGAGIMLDTGNGLLEIFANAEDNPGQGALRHIALATKDVDACIETIRKAGYLITVEPNDIVIPSIPPCAARVAFCLGPVGEEIEFFEER